MSILLVEPFYGGSHKQLVDLLQEELADCVLHTLPAKKWHWRARTAAVHFMQAIPASTAYRVIFSSSVLNLAELIALRPDLAPLRKVLYFHENQLVYPVRKCQERDFQFGYNQILSCLVADVVLFNSSFNMESFLSSIPTFLKLMPDHRPAGLDALIRRKCRIYYFPLRFPDVSRLLPEHKRARCAGVVGPVGPQELGPPGDCPHSAEGLAQNTMPRASPGPDSEHGAPSPQHTGVPQSPEENYQRRESVAPPTEGGGKQSNTSHCQVEEECDDTASQQRPLHIVWPHRWEHDKDPELFLTTLLKLKEEGLSFQVSVLGETFTEVPDVFSGAREELAARVLHWGFLSSREQYLEVLCQADVVVSTARHEFFGVAMLEAVHCGCYPLCPKALVYPEIFPAEYLYSTPEQLRKRLRDFCRRPDRLRRHRVKVDTGQFSWSSLRSSFISVLSASTSKDQ